MPPVMMTTVIPIAMIPIGAKLRVTLAAFSTVPKLGSFAAMTATSTNSAIVTQNGWLANTRAPKVCSLFSTTSEIAACPISGALTRSCCTDRSCNQAGDFLRRCRRGCFVGNLGAAPHDDDAVAHREHVGHTMADEDDRHILMLQTADEFEHLGDLAHRDGGGRFVHQDELGVGKPGAGDGHRLALAAGHFLDQIARSRFGFQFVEQFGRAVDDRLLVEHPKGPEPLVLLAAQEHVLRGGEIVGKREILVDDFDALGARLDGLMEMADLAVDENFPVRWWKIPGNQLDQGGLAGTIVAHQPHDLAGLDRPADVVYRVDSAKTLRYVTNFKQSHSGTSLSRSSSGCLRFDYLIIAGVALASQRQRSPRLLYRLPRPRFG